MDSGSWAKTHLWFINLLTKKFNRYQHLTLVIDRISLTLFGMAVNQVVIPGFAAYHIGIESTKEAMATKSESDPRPSSIDTDGEAVDSE